MLFRLAIRDLAIVGTTLLLFVLVRRLEATGSALEPAVATLAGASAAFSGFLLHEWGHLAGAALGGSRYRFPSTIRSLFLFKYDDVGNDRRQFLLMSAGGFAASALAVALLVVFARFDALADRVALSLSSLGVLATIVLELPVAIRVFLGREIPPDLVKLP